MEDNNEEEEINATQPMFYCESMIKDTKIEGKRKLSLIHQPKSEFKKRHQSRRKVKDFTKHLGLEFYWDKKPLSKEIPIYELL